MSHSLPASWSMQTLASQATIVTGKTPSTKSPELWGGDIPFVTPTDIGGDTYVGECARHLTDAGAALMKLIPAKSVLVTCIASIGKMAISNKKCVTNQQINAVIPHNVEDYKYLYYAIQSKIPELKAISGKTAVSIVNKSDFSKLEIAVPPARERRLIAEILSSVDEAIEATQAVIEQTRKVKRAALQAALEQPIGLDKTQVWPTHNLDELTPKDRKITYGIVQAGPHVPNGVPYVRVSDMGDRSLSPKGMLRTSPEIAARFTRSTILPGDIVFALRGKIGHVLMTPSSLSGANLTQGTARIAPGERVSAEFLLWALRSPTVESQIKSAVKGSTFKEITLGDLKALQVPVPPTEIQDAIVQRLDGMEDAIWTAHDHRQALVGLKASLTSDLLTGRKRVTSDLPLAAE